jgi:hypothetical protein
MDREYLWALVGRDLLADGNWLTPGAKETLAPPGYTVCLFVFTSEASLFPFTLFLWPFLIICRCNFIT